jgi:hypothetical protein
MKQYTGGFTIIETLIVLGVSTALLVTTASVFGGQQRRTQFTQGVRDLESKVQDVVNDVATGNYPIAKGLKCTPNYSSIGPSVTANVASEPGTNSGCVLAGRALLFRPDRVDIYTLVGNRYKNSALEPASSFAEAQVKIVPELTQGYDYKFGLEAFTGTGGLNVNSMIVFASSLNSSGSATSVSGATAYKSGLQAVNAYSSAPFGLLGGSTAPTDAEIRNSTSTIFTEQTVCLRVQSVIGSSLISGIVLKKSGSSISTELEGDRGVIRCS